MAPPASGLELFDKEFLASLEALRIVARRVPRGGRYAEQRSQDMGAGIEFKDYRPYAPGDDLRAIDWNIYRRLGRVFLRLFEEQEDLPLYLLPDISRSLYLETPPRIVSGLRTTLALAAISLSQHDTVSVFPFSEDLAEAFPPATGKRRVLTIADRLSALSPGGATDFRVSLGRFASLRLRPGLAVVVSDFFDPAGIDAVTEALRKLRHRLLLVSLVRESDRAPDLAGDLRLTDCETGSAVDVSVTGAVKERYRAAHARFEASLAKFAKKRGAGLLRVDADRPVVPQLAGLFPGGRFVVQSVATNTKGRYAE